MGSSTFASAKTFAHGVHPPEHKEATNGKTPCRMPSPPLLIVPLLQHLGAPAIATVSKGQQVARGEMIASPGGFVSVPMHAPLAGVVEKIDLTLLANGTMGQAIFIRPDLESAENAPLGMPVDIEALPRNELVCAVQNTGLVGLGGAAFPAHVKMSVPEGKHVEMVIANGCECEPYLTTDHRLMLERKDDLFAGLKIALRATAAERALIGVENNKPDAIEALRTAIPAGMPVEVAPVETKYPQGAEKMLIEALTGRQVPSGGLPSDIGVAVFNVATLAQLGRLLPRGQGLLERTVTITGPGVERPGNYVITLGTPLRFALEHVGLAESARQVILGGPMMGASVSSLDIPITKGVSGILVLTEKEVAERPVRILPCIRCGQCLQACPVFLNPSRLGVLARAGEYGKMEERFHLNDCFECGCCSYVCPSNIPLVQLFRMAKVRNRERKAKT
jgi:electron transport complex protein RnfC